MFFFKKRKAKKRKGSSLWIASALKEVGLQKIDILRAMDFIWPLYNKAGKVDNSIVFKLPFNGTY